jgi:hypothetical protein
VAPTSTEGITFHAIPSASGYECRLGSATFEPCSSPWVFEVVGEPGDYTGEVRAVGEGGIDPTPATFAFRSAAPVDRCGTLAHDETWSTEDISGIVVTCPVDVPAGITLTIEPGVFLKSEGGMLEVHGTLDAEGTAARPVTFTSWRDDSVGGDTNGDGDASSPAAGDWGGIEADPGSTVDLEGAALKYAATALTATEAAEATVHGAILDSEIGVSGSEGFVDATEVNWGDPSGPSPIGAGTPYEGGGVLVTPWVGYVPPVIPVDPNPYVPPSTYHCADVAFIGARGSGEDPQDDPPAFAGPEDGLGSRVGGVYSGFLDRLEQFGSSPNVKVLGVHYRALGTVSIR